MANNRHDDTTKEELKVFVKKDETWSEIKMDSQLRLSEQAKHIEQETKITLKNEVANDRIVDNKTSIVINTIDKIENNKHLEQLYPSQVLTDELSVVEQKNIRELSPNKIRLDSLASFLNDNGFLHRAIMINDLHNNKTIIISKNHEMKNAEIKTYSTNTQ